MDQDPIYSQQVQSVAEDEEENNNSSNSLDVNIEQGLEELPELAEPEVSEPDSAVQQHRRRADYDLCGESRGGGDVDAHQRHRAKPSVRVTNWLSTKHKQSLCCTCSVPKLNLARDPLS